MRDRTIRNLANLQASGSSTRVLNLHRVYREHGGSTEWAEKPLFRDRLLNRALIVKHRLRRDELQRFRGRRFVATKVILPFDPGDLGLGGRYMFVGQAEYPRTLAQNFGLTLEDEDARRLELLDRLPALDPFLLREYLRGHGVEAAGCYFDLSPADAQRMQQFVDREVAPLVDLSLGEDFDLAVENPVSRLSTRILACESDEDLALLGRTFRLEPHQYREGVFCWKGFLYYKWMLGRIVSDVAEVAEAVRTVKPSGRVDPAAVPLLDRSRAHIRDRIVEACESSTLMLAAYDRAYEALVVGGRPDGFRDFLLTAPALFARLGERLGAIEHIVSFWRYRFQRGKARPDAGELMELFADFEISLGGGTAPASPRLLPAPAAPAPGLAA
jgi:hypothetical protein